MGRAPELAAGGLLHPYRRVTKLAAPEHCLEVQFQGAGVRLKGWRCAATAERRGTVVYLQGIADNRASSIVAIKKFVPRGFDVLAYDSRAQGESEGKYCTYGYYEKLDLARILDTVDSGPIVLIGTSLGAAVALQAAAEDARVTAVVAAETFADLRGIARDRAAFLLTDATIREAFRLAERDAGFEADAVSPEESAKRIRIPVLLLHGANDRDTRPDHSRRVYTALGGPKKLVIVPGARHDGSLNPQTWPMVEAWVDDAIRPHGRSGNAGRAGAGEAAAEAPTR
jgi:alpha-beta hydrolase superfamily lysophospholipase